MHCFSNLFLVKNSTCFGQIYCPSSGVSTLYTQQQVFVICFACLTLTNLTYRGPCNVIYSYSKSQRDALFLKFIFDKELYMFRTDLLSIIRSLNTVYATVVFCHSSYDYCLLTRSRWNHPDLASKHSS